MDESRIGGNPAEQHDDEVTKCLKAIINAGRMAELFLCVMEAKNDDEVGASIASWARGYASGFISKVYVDSTNTVLRQIRLRGGRFWQLFDAVLFDETCRNNWIALLKGTDGES